MKKLLTLLTAAVAMALTVPAAVAAEVAGNVTLTSDYSFRGWSQTGRDPAIQGGFDVSFEGGFSVGTWASNVNFGDTSMEWDLYVGWSGEISDGMELGLQLIHFQYPNDTDLNYQEAAVSLSIGDFSVGLNYSPEYLAAPNETFFYPYASYSYALTEEIGLDFSVGLNIAKSDDFFGDDSEYIDYSLTASLPLGGASFGIGMVGTNLDEDACGGGRDCEARVVVSLSKDL
ncbi:MAG: TorF family putative porin [Gammaproteobacteria bacterium]|nr:TorF family putative porin [Gammaproteobacteria bacterium]